MSDAVRPALDRFNDVVVDVLVSPRAATVLSVLLTVATVLVIVLCAALLVREVLTFRALAPDRRRRYLVRATGDARWTMDEVELWAAHLSKIRRRYRVFLDRPAQALRFRLQATPDGTRYTIEGSRRIDRIMLNPVLSGLEITRLRPLPQGDHRLWRGPVTKGPSE